MTPDLNQNDVRLFLYRQFVDRARPPSVAETAEAFHASRSAVRAALESLAASHVLVLDAMTCEVAMAMPLSATPTRYRVETGATSYWAN